MATINSVLIMEKFRNDPRVDLFNKWASLLPILEQEAMFDLIVDIVTEAVKQALLTSQEK